MQSITYIFIVVQTQIGQPVELALYATWMQA